MTRMYFLSTSLVKLHSANHRVNGMISVAAAHFEHGLGILTISRFRNPEPSEREKGLSEQHRIGPRLSSSATSALRNKWRLCIVWRTAALAKSQPPMRLQEGSVMGGHYEQVQVLGEATDGKRTVWKAVREYLTRGVEHRIARV